ncbi:MAG: hypothetical protein DRP42_03000 [Tenericutes bacterium]|nr:MAG: hypothetical protein DRP42_03000 [Mycoplasmatota bacterium]
MAKPALVNVIIDREVTVEVKGKPRRTFPHGWKGPVTKAEFKIIEQHDAGRIDDQGVAPAESDTSSEADALIATAKQNAGKITDDAKAAAVQTAKDAETDASKRIDDAQATATKLVDDAQATAKGIVEKAETEAAAIVAKAKSNTTDKDAK